MCQIFTFTIEYNKSGLKGITQHLKLKKHLKKLRTLVHTLRLLGSSDANPDSMYGAPSVYYESCLLPSSSSVHKPSVHLLDRVANMEAMVVSFIAEHSLSLTMFDKLIAVPKELCKDEATLKRLKMHRTTASYKLAYGLSQTFQKVLVSTLQSIPFSLNMDESSSSNVCHVFTILVAYFSEICHDIVVEHLASLDVQSCTREKCLLCR